ncbi:concanavalin A-like lectin glucanase [Micractinium conductrix]|uniref:Concanavalin A-like lectin glucanase n=1 Tax=Micractinium conductrix TaxID=554055 RepID=A0A2P6V7T8_9CHLO|nr:concanavalin A-like lectin glucanase [Micractinium conductrix]|eukprot:PSC70155.1 concanavalin A-like lectin glucanase [Micractinium conductrix]
MPTALRRPPGAALALAVALLAGLCWRAAADVSRPGGAGHALLFRDHGVVLPNFKDLAPDALTFEAWLSTTDFCHASALMSYALDSQATDEAQRIADFNHFVVFDPSKTVACHDFQFIDLWPDPRGESCAFSFNHSKSLPNFVERDGKWHHIAVVWTAANNGYTRIYWDGLLMASAITGKTKPLQQGGALMLGAEQDCYGGCTDRGQGFYGLMDEVRLWRTARSQSEILAHMRDSSGLENHPNGIYREALVAKDSSGRGNHLPLITLPTAAHVDIQKGGDRLQAGALSFRNNYALQPDYTGMPDKDITVEFWARTPAYTPRNATPERYAEFFSFASFGRDGGSPQQASTVFMDDAILIEKYMEEFQGSKWIDFAQFSTRGSVSVHINANREGNGKRYDHWLDFGVGWLDAEWHHLAVTWSWDSGEVQLYFDGAPQVPFWSSKAGKTEVIAPAFGGVDPHIAARTSRSINGSLALGQLQDCMGGCFSPEYALHGEMANLRVWNRVLSRDDIAKGMFAVEPLSQGGLAAHYPFTPDTLERTPDGQGRVRDVHNQGANPLQLGADAPDWVYSTAPLAAPDGTPVAPPMPGSAGYAMFLSDQQVLIRPNFTMPSDEITVEFWMQSVDTCRMGVPFSYAAKGSEYAQSDNAFLIFSARNWGIAVMEDEGGMTDHLSGVSATDGKWHHIAVTWRSWDGVATLYDNGREVWQVVRAKGQKIASGGTLIIGREQDCEGGCFDSAIGGAAGGTQETSQQEYGAQARAVR